MCGSMVDIQSAAAEIRRGLKKDRRKKPQGKHVMSASATQGGHNKYRLLTGPRDRISNVCGSNIVDIYTLIFSWSQTTVPIG